MVRLVTQYKKIDSIYFRGYDGADGPFVFHIINKDNLGSSVASGVGINGMTDLTPEQWLAEHCLNNFKLELIYE